MSVCSGLMFATDFGVCAYRRPILILALKDRISLIDRTDLRNALALGIALALILALLASGIALALLSR